MSDHAPAGTTCNCGLRGWMPGVEHIPIQWPQPAWITNMAGKMQPAVIVDHIMQGYLGTMVDWASNGGSKVITHFGIGREGRTVQFQDAFTPGIHATSLNSPTARRVLARVQMQYGTSLYSVGIEHEGCSVDPVTYQVPPDVIYSPANPWPEPMVRASIEVKRWLFQTCPTLGEPSRDSIIGHYESDARNRANDPQAVEHRPHNVWPVDRIIRELAGARPPLPDELPETCTVERGDTLARIARRYGLAVDDLVAWNAITNPNRIEVGFVLRLRPPAPVDDTTLTLEDAAAARYLEGYRAGYAAAATHLAARIDALQAEARQAAESPRSPEG